MMHEQNYRETLKIVSGKHDVTGIRIYDKNEEQIPNLGMVQMEDQETGELVLVNTSSKSVRNHYEATYLDRATYFKESFHAEPVDL